MKLSAVPAATRTRLLRQSYAYAPMLVRVGTDTYLVQSKSQPDLFYRVTPAHCPCEGNTHAGYCNHRLRVSYEVHLDSNGASPIALAPVSPISRVA